MIRRFIAGYLHARSNGNSRLHSFWFAVGYVEADALRGRLRPRLRSPGMGKGAQHG